MSPDEKRKKSRGCPTPKVTPVFKFGTELSFYTTEKASLSAKKFREKKQILQAMREASSSLKADQYNEELRDKPRTETGCVKRSSIKPKEEPGKNEVYFKETESNLVWETLSAT